MDLEKEALLSTAESGLSSPNLQPAMQSKNSGDFSPLLVPQIEVEAGTPEQASPPRQRLEQDPSRLESRLNHSGSRHSLSKVFSQQQRKKEQRRQKSAQLPAHGEVQRMEQSLLKLLHEFNSGELRGFDTAYSLEQMESVRDQQEALARKHFELGAQQDLHPLLSDDGLRLARENMSQLINSLEKLSQDIGNLSCLDRMADPGIRLEQDVAARGEPRRQDRGGLVRGDTDRGSREDSVQYSRQSTMSNQTEGTNIPEESLPLPVLQPEVHA